MATKQPTCHSRTWIPTSLQCQCLDWYRSQSNYWPILFSNLPDWEYLQSFSGKGPSMYTGECGFCRMEPQHIFITSTLNFQTDGLVVMVLCHRHQDLLIWLLWISFFVGAHEKSYLWDFHRVWGSKILSSEMQ